MLKKELTLIFILLTLICAKAQIGGKNAYQFLSLVSSPRHAALGGENITNYDYDVNQALLNPAAINIEMDNQLALNYINYIGDVNYGSAAYAHSFDGLDKIIFAGVTYVNYGTFDGRDEQGNETGDFTGNEMAFSVGYSMNIKDTDFYIGSNIKFISSNLEQYNSLGGALDLSLFYKNDINNVNASIVVRNLGVQFTTYAGLKESLPLEVIAGVSQKLEHVPIRWHLTFENLHDWNLAFSNPAEAEESIDGTTSEEKINFPKEFIRHTVIGAELFPDKGFNVRVGYNFKRGVELRVVDQRNFSGLTAGFGIKFNKIRFNYTFAKYGLAQNSSFFGLMMNFN